MPRHTVTLKANLLQRRQRRHETKSARQSNAAFIPDGVMFQPDTMYSPTAHTTRHSYDRRHTLDAYTMTIVLMANSAEHYHKSCGRADTATHAPRTTPHQAHIQCTSTYIANSSDCMRRNALAKAAQPSGPMALHSRLTPGHCSVPPHDHSSSNQS
jgi:hypothetical protein